jgi:hypothetical protein
MARRAENGTLPADSTEHSTKKASDIMPIRVTCSSCGGVLHAPDDAGGKRGKCPTCGNILPIPAPTAASAGSFSQLPDPPAPKGVTRQASFGDFAVGPDVGPPPAAPVIAAAQPAPRKAPEPKAAPAPAPTYKAPAPAPMMTGSKPTHVTDSEVRHWGKARSGLWMLGLANFFFFIPLVALPGMAIVEHFTKSPLLPDQQIDALGQDVRHAVPVLIVLVPVLLGLLFTLFGRLGLISSPKGSCTRGPFRLSLFGTLIAVCGFVAVIFPDAVLLATGEKPIMQLFAMNTTEAIMQHLGLFLGVAAWIVGEFWYSSGMGRIGANLSDGPTAARATKYQLVLGLVLFGWLGTAVLQPTEFGFGKTTASLGSETNSMIIKQNWNEYVSPQLAQLGEYQVILFPALVLVGGLVAVLMQARLIGAARNAIREHVG